MYEVSSEGSGNEELKAEENAYREILIQYGPNVITFNKGPVNKELRWALMAISDIWMLTSLRQGYSLYPLEYIAVRGILGKNYGNMVISNFAGSINSLASATIINPYNVFFFIFSYQKRPHKLQNR